MSRKVLAPLLIGVAAASFGLAATAGSAQAANCTPTVTVNPSPVTAGSTMTITGHNFACLSKANNRVMTDVIVDIYNPAEGQLGNGPQVHLNSAGGFTYTDKAFGVPNSTLVVQVDGHVYATVTIAASTAPIDPTVETAAPTAVPAGHVAVSKSGSDDATEIGLVAAAGLVLVAGGVTVGLRGRGSHASA